MPALRAGTLLQLLLAAATIGALAVLTLDDGGGRGVEVLRRDPPAGIDEIRVAVSGAVLTPGVVTVPPGGRVGDALQLAGGMRLDAEPAALNLSRRVHDEDQIVVPTRGTAALLDLNAASAADLDALPGIGAAYSTAIVEARAEQRFASTDDLVDRDVLPERIYRGIRDLIAVR